MTHSPSPEELAALKVANAAIFNSPDASVDIVATIVFALGSAQLLQPPKAAAATVALRARVVELEQLLATGGERSVDEDLTAYKLTALAKAPRRTTGEDRYDSPLHHAYRVPRDLPPVPDLRAPGAEAELLGRIFPDAGDAS